MPRSSDDVASHAAAHVGRRGRDLARPLSAVALVGVVVLIAICLGWRIQGGRWERVETASMGTLAPVGTLLWVKPVDFSALKPGDFITFRPPGSTGVTYSHLVLRRNADGTIMTKGLLSAPDPWRLHDADVVGSVQMHWWGAGWLLAVAPLVIGGLLVIAVLRRLLSERWRLPATVLLGSLLLSVAISWQKPLINAQQLAFTPTGHGGATATYVGTGLLPIRLTAQSGPRVVLHDGEVGTVHVAKPDHHGWLRVSLTPQIPWWWWAAMVLACFVPALVTSIRPLPRPPVARHAVV